MLNHQSWVQGPASLDIEEGDPGFERKNAFFERLLEQFDCGPSDGGCLVVAKTIQSVHGGEIWVIQGALFGAEIRAQHAVVRIADDRYADAYGEGSDADVILNFRRLAIEATGKDLSLRPYKSGDLPDACDCDEATIADLAAFWQCQNVQHLKHVSRPPRLRM